MSIHVQATGGSLSTQTKSMTAAAWLAA